MPVNQPTDGKCGYKAFYNRKEIELYADSLYQAKQRAITHFKPKKSQEHMVNIVLCEVESETVVHVADF